jgi:transposase-like protein
MNILNDLPSEAKCRAIFSRATFGPRIHCPRCGSGKVKRSSGRHRCPGCRRYFSATSVSWLSGTKLPYRSLYLLLVCWQRRIAFGTTISLTGLSHITVRRWFRKFRNNLAYASPGLSGTVEIDESFLGRMRTRNQRIVLGALERKTGKVILRAVPNRSQDVTDRFILRHVKRGSHVCTDSAQCYNGIDKFFGYRHETCNHSKYVFGPTNLIESVWSRLKRFITRTFQQYRKYWLPQLLREFEARINAPELFDSPLTFLENSLCVVPRG